MATTSSYSTRSSSVKRLLQEAKELRSPSVLAEGIHAAPLEDNLHEFHFTIRGPQDSEFQDGLYHGRILLPAAYPFKAPDIMLLTPNGRFELNKKVCLTITGFHEESWQPAWGIRTALVGLMSFFQTEAKGAIGGLDAPVGERRRLAGLSKNWSCPMCQMKNDEILPSEQDQETLGKENENQKNAAAEQECRSSSTEPSKREGDVAAGPLRSKPQAEAVQSKPSLSSLSASEATRETVRPLSTIPSPSLPPLSDAPSGPSLSTSSRAAPIPHITFHAPTPLPSSTSPIGSASATRTGTPSIPSQPSGSSSSSSASAAHAQGHSRGHEDQLKMIELLTRGLNLNAGPSSQSTSAGSSGHARTESTDTSATGDIQILEVGAADGLRRSGGESDSGASPPPVWLDGMIGLVLVALASLLCRKMM